MSEYTKKAERLLQQGDLESAGVAIGRALENILKRLCDERKLPIKFKHDIAKYNNMLRDKEVISGILYSRIDVCRDIRNTSSHDADNQVEKITETDVKFGIETVERIVRQFFPQDIAIKILMQENQKSEQSITPELLDSLSGYIEAGSPSSAIPLLKQSVFEYVQNNPGSGKTDIAKGLKISSHDENGNTPGRFSDNILKILVEEGMIKKSNRNKYHPEPSDAL